MNLLNNSKFALGEMGDPHSWVKINVEGREKDVRILIIDSGPGLPETAVKKWAQPFFTTKEVGSGMGLGLSIVRSILKEHTGTINYLDGQPNTTFEIVLPYEIDHEALERLREQQSSDNQSAS